MKESIKKRIEAVRRGEVPEGYRRTRAGIMPLDWQSNLAAKDIFRNHTDKKHNGEFQVLSATQDRGIIPRSEVDIDIKYAEENIGSYKKVEPGNFVISLRSFQGGIEYSEYEGLVSPAYTVLKPTRPISDNYYRAYFKTPDFISRLNGAVYGIRDGKQIGFEDFGELAVHYPPLVEQQKIAEILSTCDRVIELKQCKIDELNKLKQTYLRKMFPQEGQTVPEVRFPGFSDPWEQRKLGQVGSVSMCRRIFKEQTSESGDIPFYKIGTFGGQADAYISSELFSEYKSKYPYPKEGDILISASGSVGRTVEFTGKKEYFQDSNIVWLSHDDRLDNPFLKCFYSVVKWAGIEGSTIKRLYNDNILNTVISLPTVDEQRQIGSFFKELDNLIALHQGELEEYGKYKKALMQLLLTGLVRVNA